MGFFGVAEATTFKGDVRLLPSVGFEIVSGKSFEPAGGGTCAGGAGSLLVDGDHVIGTGGVEGYPGCGGVVPDVVLLLPHAVAKEMTTVTNTEKSVSFRTLGSGPQGSTRMSFTPRKGSARSVKNASGGIRTSISGQFTAVE